MDILWQSTLGGLGIAFTLLAAKFLGPKAGGVLLFFPIMFVASYLVITQFGADVASFPALLRGMVLGFIAFWGFVLSLWWANAFLPYWGAIGFATLVWLLLAIIFVFLLPSSS